MRREGRPLTHFYRDEMQQFPRTPSGLALIRKLKEGQRDQW
jgi:hypothetical protein